MFDHLAEMLSNKLLYPVKIATTEEEKNAVFHFRYHVYIEQMHQHTALDVADHVSQRLFDKSDFETNTVIFYIEEAKNIIATVTLRVWAKGDFPIDLQKKYDVNFFPFANNMTLGEWRFMIIDESRRSKLSFASIVKGISNYLSQKKLPLDMVFTSCMPGLVNYEMKLGFRLYTNKYVINKNGIRIPLLLIPYDRDHFKNTSFFFGFFVKKYTQAISGTYEQNLKLINSFLAKHSQNLYSVITAPEKIEKLFENSGLDPESCRLLSVLSLKEVASLCGLILNVPNNLYIINEGTEDREIFIILDGSVDVEIEKNKIKALTKGAIFGEIAFFLEKGMRSADIYATTDVTLGVIRRNDVKRFMKRNPALANKFLFTIAQIICTRLADVINSYLSKHNQD